MQTVPGTLAVARVNYGSCSRGPACAPGASPPPAVPTVQSTLRSPRPLHATCSHAPLLVCHVDIPCDPTRLVAPCRYFLRQIATRVLQVEGQKLIDYQGDYEYYLTQNE
jgi:hypothetical protein